MVSSKTSSSSYALFFYLKILLLPDLTSQPWDCTCPLPLISINGILKSKWKNDRWCYYVLSWLLAGFKIAFFSSSENPSHLFSIRRKYLQVLSLFLKRQLLRSSAKLHSRVPSPGRSWKMRRKWKNQQVSKWSCAFNQGLNYLTMKMSFPGLMRVA